MVKVGRVLPLNYHYLCVLCGVLVSVIFVCKKIMETAFIAASVRGLLITEFPLRRFHLLFSKLTSFLVLLENLSRGEFYIFFKEVSV